MSDLHEIAHAASDAATPPDFTELRRRGLRRRRVRRTTWAGGAVLAVAGVIALAQLPGGDPAPSPAPPVNPTITTSPSPSEANPSDEVDAAAIVDDPAAYLRQLALDPADPDVMAALWSCDQDCAHQGSALALTGDGFRTRALEKVQGGGELTALGGGAFHYHPGVGPGDIHRVPGIAAQPAAAGVVVSIGSGLHLWTLIEADGPGNRVENAEDYRQIVPSPDGSLTAIGIADSGEWLVARSSDDGATWDEQRLNGTAPAPLFSILPSAGAPALLESGDGATFAPIVATWRLEASGRWVRFAGPTDPTAYVAGQVVLPDGRLFTAVDIFSDARPGELGTPPGFFVSDGDDWSVFERQDSPFPFDYHPEVLAISASSGRATVVVAEPQGVQGEAYRSVDGGRTWTPLTTR